jgi:prepilin-type N-terminal cleavage/methylation domain-containing protein
MTNTTSPRGFSLIEIIVSVGIFAVVMLVATSAYYTMISLDRRARSTTEVVSNLSFALEAMARGMRTGTAYKCVATGGNSTDGTCSCFSYSDSALGTPVTYHLMANKTVGRATGTSSCLDSLATSITDRAITVSSLVFYVRNVGSSDDYQPQVLFTIKGTMPADNTGSTTVFVLEQSATQRLIDL